MSKNKKKIIIVIAIFLILSVLLVLATQVITKISNNDTDSDDESMSDNMICSATLYGNDYIYSDNISTYLLIGVDDSESDSEDYNGGMADFLSVLIVNDTKKTYSVLQLDRDTMTEVLAITSDGLNQENRIMQLCNSHWYGANEAEACENTTTAVSNLMGEITIDYYAQVNISSIAKLNSLVDGVTLKVSGDFSNTDIGLVDGQTVTLTDEQAEMYVRGRMAVDDGSNVERMRRQREYMMAFANQFKKKTEEDVQFAVDSYDKLKNDIVTNGNDNVFSKVVNKLQKYENLGIYKFEGEIKVGKALDDNIEHTEFYPNEDSVVEIMTELFSLEKDS